ncbi:MAG TPA: recombinase family protein, partial [Actinomycetes bacterium]|nr:recombinase family protein [Actinomycetes bacterium]
MGVKQKSAKRAAIYARLSLATEESVSIERQVKAARTFAKARGWDVVLVATDDGVSATRHRPEKRPGWQEILKYPDPLDAVIVWKVDRLARSTLDFLHADEALRERRAGLVAVEDPIDMTSAQGRAFATMLAVFGEMEAAAMSARAKAARAFMVSDGRAVGNRPWPYESVPNPSGQGLVWRPIPERAKAVKQAAKKLSSGSASLASIARDWSEHFPPPHGGETWNPASVRVLLISPVLTGATLYGGDVVRGEDGLVVRDKKRQILTVAEHKAVVGAVAARRYREGRRPIRLPLLHGIAACGSCGSRLQISRPQTGGVPT